MMEAELIEALRGTALAPWAERLPSQLAAAYDPSRHGNLTGWREVIHQLPQLEAAEVVLDHGAVSVRGRQPLDAATRDRMVELLMRLHPWRKGPYDLHGIHLDTEWRSDWKWDRVAPHISDLTGRTVLDVGCGSGYHCWRMAGAGARRVIGIDPTLLFAMQFAAVKRLLGEQWPVHVLPLGIEDVPPRLLAFDTVFSMGVLYHRRSPIDHLIELREALRPGGELVLETLVIDGGLGQVLMPEGRYAKMRNVWYIPTTATLALWLRRAGFHDIRVVDVTVTSTEEQRRTEWMTFESLRDFLDPDDVTRTIEGYPAPMRATIVAAVE